MFSSSSNSSRLCHPLFVLKQIILGAFAKQLRKTAISFIVYLHPSLHPFFSPYEVMTGNRHFLENTRNFNEPLSALPDFV
jgi:hypothetical protein